MALKRPGNRGTGTAKDRPGAGLLGRERPAGRLGPEDQPVLSGRDERSSSTEPGSRGANRGTGEPVKRKNHPPAHRLTGSPTGSPAHRLTGSPTGSPAPRLPGSPVSRAVLAAFLVAACLLSTFPADAGNIQADEIPTGLPSSINLYAIAWNPSGSEALAVGDGQAVIAYKEKTGSFRKVEAPSAPDFLMGVAWNPDSTFAMAVGSDGVACLYNGQAVTAVVTGTTKYLYDADFWPGSQAALVVGAEGTILRYAGGTFSPLQSGVTTSLMGVSCRAADGSALVVGLNSTFLRVAPDGSVAKIAFEGDWSLHAVAWNPAGTVAVITGANGIVATYDGAAVRFINQDTPNVFLDVCWKPDGTQALICGDTGIILRLLDGKLTYIDPGIRGLIQGIAYRPDGSYALAVGNKAKCVRYPMKPAPKQPDLLADPFVLGGIIVIVVVLVSSVGYMDWREKRELAPRNKTGRHHPVAEKKRRH